MHFRTVLFQNERVRQNFEQLCIYARRFSGFIPISFLIGFYVTQVVSRWWSEFLTLPWPDKIAFRLVSYIPGKVLFNQFHVNEILVAQINILVVISCLFAGYIQKESKEDCD